MSRDYARDSDSGTDYSERLSLPSRTNEPPPEVESIVDPDVDEEDDDEAAEEEAEEDPDEDADEENSTPSLGFARDSSPIHVVHRAQRARRFAVPNRVVEAPQFNARAQRAPEHRARTQYHIRNYSPILPASEYKFWFNRAHSKFLKRLRTQQRFSIRRSIYLAVLALYVSYDDFRVWNHLYGPVGAISIAALAKKSIWKLQAEVLASVIDELQWRYEPESLKEKAPPFGAEKSSTDPAQQGIPIAEKQEQGNGANPISSEGQGPHRVSRAPSADSHRSERPGSEDSLQDRQDNAAGRRRSPMNQRPHDSPRRNIDRYAPIPPAGFSGPGLSFKKAVEDESARIGTSGGIITAVAMAALALPNVSQTHWIARSCWTSSMVTALLAVYFSNDQAWTISHLSSENRLRAWIMDVDPTDDYEEALLQRLKHQSQDSKSVILNSITPAPSSAITISAPSLLLSSSLLLLLSGMGVFLAFIWTREIDQDAGTASSRDVFIVYIVTLGVSLATVGFFSLGRVAVPIRYTIIKSLIGLSIDARREGMTNRVDKKEVLLYRQLQSMYDARELMERQGARLEEKIEDLQRAYARG